jgi:hypothetical protein
MSGWNDDDEVTTTYGSIQLSLGQAHAAGVKTERERIIMLLNNIKSAPACFELDLDKLIAILEGKSDA